MLETAGIVFRTVKYGETSVIADIFTEEKGLHTFIGGGVRTAKARMPFSLFQPMTVVDLVSYFRDEPGVMNRLRELRAAEVWQQIPFDIKRGAVVLFMAEICRKCIQEGDENRELFDYLLHTLRWLDATPGGIANLPLHFLLHFSACQGFQPQVEPGDREGERFFDMREGIFSPVPPPHALHLDPESTAYMMAILDSPVEECAQIPIPRTQRKVLLDRLLQFYELHVPGFSHVHSPEILELILKSEG